MNWYQRRQKIAQVASGLSGAASQIAALEAEIVRALSVAKSQSEVRQFWTSNNLNWSFNNMGNAMKAVLRNLTVGNVPGAAAQIESAQQCLQQICSKVNCQASQVWSDINRILQNAWQIINQL